jgi:hypothetical protein
MRPAVILALAASLLLAEPVLARAYRAPAAHFPHPKPPAASRHRAGMAEIKPLGPTTFHPVKRYKGFSYLEHEKHPEKDD